MNTALQRPAAAVLRLRGLAVGFNDRVVLRHVDLDVLARGVLGIMGPGGTGKSTLLKTLARINHSLPSFWWKGDVLLEGRSLMREIPLEEAHRMVPLLAQKARLFTATVLENAIAEIRPDHPLTRLEKLDLAHRVLAPLGLWSRLEPHLSEPVISLPLGDQRCLSLARLAGSAPVCLLADEPLRDLPPPAAEELAGLLLRVASERAVVMVTHHQGEARRLCDRVALLVDGRIVEVGAAEEFFSQPRTELGRTYVRFGNCWPQGEEGEAEVVPAPQPVPSARRLTGFHWVIPGLLAGAPQPGLLAPIEEDLAALSDLGCRVLVSLTERPLGYSDSHRFGIENLHLPVPDMGVPTLDEAAALAAEVWGRLDLGQPAVLHCKAGLGRTGTLLACILVARGENAPKAVERVREVNPRYIQSEEQLAFIGTFAEYVADGGARSVAGGDDALRR